MDDRIRKRRNSGIAIEHLLMAGCDAPLPPGAEELVCGEMVHILARNIATKAHDANTEALRSWRWACIRCERKMRYAGASVSANTAGANTNTAGVSVSANTAGVSVSANTAGVSVSISVSANANANTCGVVINPTTNRGVSDCGTRHVYELGQVAWLTVTAFPVGSVRESSNQRRG